MEIFFGSYESRQADEDSIDMAGDEKLYVLIGSRARSRTAC